jgi:hypothetical protein
MSRSVIPLTLALALAGAPPTIGQEAQLVVEGREVALKACARCHILAED